jgi:hypothetical protein
MARQFQSVVEISVFEDYQVMETPCWSTPPIPNEWSGYPVSGWYVKTCSHLSSPSFYEYRMFVVWERYCDIQG